MIDIITKLYFIDKIKCNYLLNNILFLAIPTLNQNLKKDITTFHYTWSTYKSKYLSVMSEFAHDHFYLFEKGLMND